MRDWAYHKQHSPAPTRFPIGTIAAGSVLISFPDPPHHASSALRLDTVLITWPHMAKVRSICFHQDEGFIRPHLASEEGLHGVRHRRGVDSSVK